MLASDGSPTRRRARGPVLGSAFVDERGVIAGIGPVTVDPSTQDSGVAVR